MTVAFQTRGELPEWKLIENGLIADGVVVRAPGEIVTYAELDGLLGRRFKDNRAPWYQARKHILEEHSRAFINVPGIGYRVVAADEHEVVAGQHQRRAKRQVRTAVTTLTNVRLKEMTNEKVKRRNEKLIGLAQVEQAMKNMSRRVNVVEVRQDVAEETVEDLVVRLKALEAQVQQQKEAS